jgi:predicted transcriptional regulator
MSRTATITFRITPELKKRLQSFAEAERRSMSQLIEIILEEYVAAQAKSRKRG